MTIIKWKLLMGAFMGNCYILNWSMIQYLKIKVNLVLRNVFHLIKGF